MASPKLTNMLGEILAVNKMVRKREPFTLVLSGGVYNLGLLCAFLLISRITTE